MEKQQKEDYGKPLSSTFESLIKEVETGPFYPGPPRMSAKKEPLSQKEIALIDDFREQVYNNGILSQKEIDEILEKHGLRADRPITQEEIDYIIDKLQPLVINWEKLNRDINYFLKGLKKGTFTRTKNLEYFELINHFRVRVYRGERLTQKEIDEILKEHGLRADRPITQEEIDNIIDKLQPFSACWQDLNDAIDAYLAHQKKGVTNDANFSEYFGLIDHLRTWVYRGENLTQEEIDAILAEHGLCIDNPLTQEEIDVIINKLQLYEISWEKVNEAIDKYFDRNKRGVITRVNNSEYFGLIDHIFSRVVDGGCIPPNGLEKELEKQGIKPSGKRDAGFEKAMQDIEKAREWLKDCK
jgi:hypothetical protein